MKAQDFEVGAPGRLVPQTGPSGDYLAYVPDPLPPELSLGMKTIGLLSRADQALGELNGVGLMLPNSELLIGPFLRREAVSSSSIEGTQTDFEQLLLFEAEAGDQEDEADAQEVFNHVAAMRYGLDRLPTFPISLRLIREIHERLMQGVRGEDKAPGEFRRRQNMIGSKSQGPADARFVPPPVEFMAPALNDLERYIGNRSDWPVLIDSALIHYQFETIHPFLDGNGRLGRLLINLLLIERGALSKALLFLSPYLERNKEEYVGHLLDVSRGKGWVPWLEFFLNGVAVQAHAAVSRSHELLALREKYRSQSADQSNSTVGVRLIDMLFDRPAVTITGVAKTLGVTYRAANSNVQKLLADNVLVEITGRGRGRVYLAREIVQVIEKDQD